MGYLWYTDQMRTFVFLSALFLTTLTSIFAPERWYNSETATLLFVGGVLAFLVGEFTGSSYVARTKPIEVISLKSGTSPVPVRIIRAGERGVLFVTPETGTVEFALWENVKSLSAKPAPSLFDKTPATPVRQ